MNIPANKLASLERIQQKILVLDISRIKYLPRSVVFLIDTLLLIFALAITYMALEAINVSFHDVLSMPIKMSIVVGVNLLFFRIFRTYAGLIRHSSFVDILKLALASSATIGTVAVIQYSYFFLTGQKIFIVIGVLLYTLLSFTLLLVFRVFVKQVYHVYTKSFVGKEKKKIVILGIDDHAISLGKALATENGQDFDLVAFLSQKPFKNIQIAGKPVISVKDTLNETLSKLKIDGVLIIGKTLTVQEKNEVVNTCIGLKLQVFNAPLVEEWNSSIDFSSKIKAIEIEDLLDREAIKLDEKDIQKDIKNKTILVTGAAGSIGSELVRQIAKYKPLKMVLVDQAESPLYAIELELQEKFPDLNFQTVLATISNKYRMEAIFEMYNFSIVFHAAAYKHVPMIESNPREAIIVNVLGTVNLANIASEHKVEKFVMISTDKAVNPTNVMGASKRAAEMYVQSFQHLKENTTQFITTRFGNVLGSNGSVIPHFKDQISKGGPITVTHPDIIRYFMTIPEACQLVLQAGTMGKGGEIFVFDMGKPVKILDLAKRMIKLSGFEPFKDIDIQISGLRPGEKLFEELLSDSSKNLPTHNQKIMVAKDTAVPYQLIKPKIKELVTAGIKFKDQRVMVKLLKELVPEFKSKNSSFEALDQKVNDEDTPRPPFRKAESKDMSQKSSVFSSSA